MSVRLLLIQYWEPSKTTGCLNVCETAADPVLGTQQTPQVFSMSTTLTQHHSNIGTMLGDCWEVI